jgi:hypothetical protein
MIIHTAGRAATLVAAFALLTATGAVAQDLPADHPTMTEADAALMEAAMVTMSHDEIVGLLEGKGLGMAKAAEKNGFPGPKHVLELEDKLELTDEQKVEVTDIFVDAQVDFRTLGREVVEAEAALNRAFAARGISQAQIASLTRAAAEARGNLQARHLAAHVATRPVLSDAQVQKYVELRTAMAGQGGGAAGAGMQHGQGMQQGQGMQHGQGQGAHQCQMHQGGEGQGAHQCQMHQGGMDQDSDAAEDDGR